MATGQAAAIARTAILDADMARPQGSLLTVMGRKTNQLIAAIGDIEGRIAAGLRAEPSPQDNDHQFEPLGDNYGEVSDQTRITGIESFR